MVRGTEKARLGFVALGFSILLLSALLQGCSSSTPVTEAAARPSEPARHEVAATTPTTQEDSYVASGPIVVENQVDVLAQREGMMAEISADVSKVVRKGDLLGRLDDRQLNAQRDALEAKLRSCEASLKDWQAETSMAETDLKRAQQMHDVGVNTQEALDHARYKYQGSQFEIEKAKNDLENAQANLRDLQLELQKTRIEAPFDGVVARRYVRAGQKVASGDRLFWVSAIAPLLVKFTLPERLMQKLKKGDPVYVSSASAPDTQHTAKVVQISPVVDPASDSVDVMAELQGKPTELRPGMTADVRLSPLSKPR
jgi:RND family efflux transporter MFP subunit